MYLLRIISPHFVAGLEIAYGKVHRAAPIISYMKGWALEEIATYTKKQGWSFSLVLDNAANKHLLETRTANRSMTPGPDPRPAGNDQSASDEAPAPAPAEPPAPAASPP